MRGARSGPSGRGQRGINVFLADTAPVTKAAVVQPVRDSPRGKGAFSFGDGDGRVECDIVALGKHHLVAIGVFQDGDRRGGRIA